MAPCLVSWCPGPAALLDKPQTHEQKDNQAALAHTQIIIFGGGQQRTPGHCCVLLEGLQLPALV